MFNYSDLQDIHFEITSRCQAKCPMCIRNYHGGVKNPLLKLTDWTLQDFKKIATPKLLEQINGYYMCGNFGDPIINDDMLDMIAYSSKINPNLNIRVHTNGSARTTAWWQELASVMPSTHKVIFAIDGLEDTHSLYRIGTSYKKIIDNASAFIQEGGTAEWCFIKFKHNEHQVEEAKKQADDLGFRLFTEKNTSRFIGEPKFDVYDSDGKTLYSLEQPSESKTGFISKELVKDYRNVLKDAEIDCYVKKTKEVFIDAQKNVFPCCFLASAPYVYWEENELSAVFRRDVLDQYKNLRKTLGNTNALQVSIKDIINSPAWQTAWQRYWGDDKLLTCARTCGNNLKLDKPKDQFNQIVGFQNNER